MAKNQNLLEIENAKLVFTNFAGKERKNPKNNQIINREGQRNFCIMIDPDEAERLKADGWNVKTYSSGDEYDEPLNYIQVAVEFDKGFPPTVWMITRRNRTLLNAETIDALDGADIKQADIRIRPYLWEVNGKAGIKAYLQEMYVVIEEDKWEQKYAEYMYPEE
ncbi:MAG: hypothetical protein IJ716_14505 [Lachnospiraceae bacterium]|nr:hypothetical protein [Lachnospiraceae bacterium]